MVCLYNATTVIPNIHKKCARSSKDYFRTFTIMTIFQKEERYPNVTSFK